MLCGSRACLTFILSDHPHRPSRHFDGVLPSRRQVWIAASSQAQHHDRPGFPWPLAAHEVLTIRVIQASIVVLGQGQARALPTSIGAAESLAWGAPPGRMV
jgi:hypothetical protein